ncbi:hypothetical protein ROR02_19450 [Pararhodospirillum oryzae]|uniref:Uncharacterized protein n=1 Tax=Pararhodospirillum oryzae TaxID=478448 RepID=A0A512H8N0_9PROT|nr:hypothetical protein ROR02_19450 [Pararhodospirillum oryzae]
MAACPWPLPLTPFSHTLSRLPVARGDSEMRWDEAWYLMGKRGRQWESMAFDRNTWVKPPPGAPW